MSSANPPMPYRHRILDDELDILISGLPALSIDGPKGVGKTATAAQRAATFHRLDRPEVLSIAVADPDRLVRGPEPILIDEWQRWEPSWDLVRRAVDQSPHPGRFLLTGSASPASPQTHSGAGRIVSLRMRPLTLAEREIGTPTVSLARLLNGVQGPIEGATTVDLEQYVEQIIMGGFPGMRSLSPRVQTAQLASYVGRIVDRDFREAGQSVRNPAALRRWMTAYAAATGTSTTFEKIRDVATAGSSNAPARSTTIPYRDTLERIWISDPVPGWMPTRSHLNRLTTSPKHHLADPALAVALLNVDASTLLEGREGAIVVPREGTLLGALFESLVALNLRVYAQAAEATVGHLRTKSGDREVDFVIQGRGGRTVAVEVKLATAVDGRDVRHLLWLKERLGPDLTDMVIVTTGTEAYRRPDGIAVVPLALFGP